PPSGGISLLPAKAGTTNDHEKSGTALISKGLFELRRGYNRRDLKQRGEKHGLHREDAERSSD
ncbi:MAG: hypothetical protein AAF497_05560, partial [Planctomycetota bacterium]